MKKITILFLLSIHFLLHSQPTVEFGKVSPEELKINSFPGDDEAEAIIIYDKGHTYFRADQSGNYDVVFERRTKIKILKEAGLKWGEVEIPLYRHGNIYERLEDVEAVTANLEERKLYRYVWDQKDRYKEKVNDYIEVVKIALPSVKSGSIIEYKYKIVTPYIFQLPEWEFQKRIPVMYSEYQVDMIPFYSYVFLLQGTNKFDYNTSYINKGLPRYYDGAEFNDYVHIYALKNIPAFRDEDFISSYKDYVIKIGFQLQKIIRSDGVEMVEITSWDKMVNHYLNDHEFIGYINASKRKAKKILTEIDLKNKTHEEKVKEIVNYVKSNYNWDGKRGRYAQKNIREFLNQKTGSTPEINLFLTGLLRAAGINADPVIISTRDHGKILYDYPFFHFFNSVIILVTIDDTLFLTDGTSMLYAYNDIPLYNINQKGLVIKKGDVKWVNLSALRSNSQLTKHFQLSIDNDLKKIKCQLNLESDGYESVGIKNMYENEEKYFEKYLEKKGYEDIGPIQMKNFYKPEKPYIIQSTFTTEIENIDGKIFISPFLKEVPHENIFKQTSRQNDIDMVYTRTKYYKSEIEIPDDYSVTYKPEDVNIENEFMRISYAIKNVENKINCEASFAFKSPVYKASEYTHLKYFYGETVKKLNDKVIIEKTNE